MAGRPKKGVKKSGSLKKSAAANSGPKSKLKSESAPRTAVVGLVSLTPNSKSKYYAFHNKRRLDPNKDVPDACEDDNKMHKEGGGDVQPQPVSFGVKEFYSSVNYFFKETVKPRSTPSSSRKERRSLNFDDERGRGRGRGKPPLNGETAMTPEEVKKRKRGLQQ